MYTKKTTGTCRSEEGTANFKISVTNTFVQLNSIFSHVQN
jgi:hypothetical protein